MLIKRLASGAILVAVVIPLVWVGGPFYLAAVVALAILASWEYAKMLAGVGHRPLYPLLFGLAVLLPLEAYWRSVPVLLGDLLAAFVLLSLTIQVLRRNLKHALADWALSLAGGLYISLLISYFILLRNLPDGAYWVLLTFLCTWLCDSGAYLAGSNLGRHGFFTHISPKKTVEGAIGGVLAGTVAALLAVPFLNVPFVHAFLLGIVVSLAATFGDLAESLIKRQLKAKDSGSTIPGHGGFLDRMDSLLFAVVIVYLYAVWFA